MNIPKDRGEDPNCTAEKHCIYYCVYEIRISDVTLYTSHYA